MGWGWHLNDLSHERGHQNQLQISASLPSREFYHSIPFSAKPISPDSHFNDVLLSFSFKFYYVAILCRQYIRYCFYQKRHLQQQKKYHIIQKLVWRFYHQNTKDCHINYYNTKWSFKHSRCKVITLNVLKRKLKLKNCAEAQKIAKIGLKTVSVIITSLLTKRKKTFIGQYSRFPYMGIIWTISGKFLCPFFSVTPADYRAWGD
jgi:hypothetical protein